MPTVKELKSEIKAKWSKIQDAQIRQLVDQLIQQAEFLERSNKQLQTPGAKPSHIRPRGEELANIQAELDLEQLSDESGDAAQPSLRQSVRMLMDYAQDLEATYTGPT